MTEQRNKGGRPKFVPTAQHREVVMVMAGVNLPQSKIVLALGLKDEKTLRKHFRKELDQAAAKVEAQLASNLYGIAGLKSNPTAALKAIEMLVTMRFGWSRYAPPPPMQKEQELGKKEALNHAAQTGHEETSWGDVVH